ncbi:CLUMA_CG019819, isoform A [Clunio marinus]|uniref:CLUMA_CG019819, isoform A n=1 Tax=Clunio marinus TaxID=568069 RepID=A0A1J1J2B1_9DIPT|nr:CLUMA_CG019819, isoform A [Clunio marinus]
MFTCALPLLCVIKRKQLEEEKKATMYILKLKRTRATNAWVVEESSARQNPSKPIKCGNRILSSAFEATSIVTKYFHKSHARKTIKIKAHETRGREQKSFQHYGKISGVFVSENILSKGFVFFTLKVSSALENFQLQPLILIQLMRYKLQIEFSFLIP